MNNQVNINEILPHFNIKSDSSAYGNGHINDTYLTATPKIIIQRINTNVFKKPDELMSNIERVTNHIREKIKSAGGDYERGTLTIIKTADGNNCVKHQSGNVFRAYKYIDGTKTIEDDKTLEDIYNAGVGFGEFQRMLEDFNADELYETIPDFHNTPKRVEALKEAIEKDALGRRKSVEDEIEFALSRAYFAGAVVNGMAGGEIPVRVTHNDTKINNILFDEKSGEPVAVIDLDTVMPGSLLYDFGDALRMGASTAAEDETDLGKVFFDTVAFKEFAAGYLSRTKEIMTETEIELLPFSAKLMTYECGIRFLTDYLNGDTYFKIHREGHNLDRARNQFKIVEDIENKNDALCRIVKGLIDK